MERAGATRHTRVVGRGGLDVRLIRSCAVRVLDGPSRGLEAEVERAIFRIGSHASNDLVLADDTVSKHHLELEVGPDGYRVVDLSSSNGTFAGGLRVRDVTITEPIVLTLGATTLSITPDGAEVELAASSRTRFGALVGQSAPMRELFAQLEAVARSDAAVLVEGETGTGKELLAESLHQESARAGGPFVIVDCGGLSPSLFEAELCGVTRGAFTGATTDRPGLLLEARGGTVVLDEIGELGPALQAKLLGPLQRRSVVPVGGAKPIPFDARVIATSRRDLAREVNEGRFRADLFYRIAVVRLRVPPLRARREDVPLLAADILADLRQAGGVDAELSAIALARLVAQRWPGNVRELRNAIEAALLGLPAAPATAMADPSPSFAQARETALDEFETRWLADLLDACDGNVSEAARRAGLDRRNFQRLLRRRRL